MTKPLLHPRILYTLELETRGWDQADLARVLDERRPLPTVNEIIHGKRAIMPEMAVDLGTGFETGPQFSRATATESGSEETSCEFTRRDNPRLFSSRGRGKDQNAFPETRSR